MQVNWNPNRLFLWAFATALGGLTACSSSSVSSAAFQAEKLAEADRLAETATAPHLRLLVSANVNGETEPCGCAVNPKGGLDRRWNYVEQAKASAGEAKVPLFLVDAGNAFFPSLRLDPSKLDFFRARARTLAKGHALMGLKVHNVGALDLGLGPDFLHDLARSSGIQFLSSNWTSDGGERLFEASLTVEENGIKVTYVGVSGGRDENPVSGTMLKDPFDSVAGVLKGVPADHVVVILSDLGVAQDRELWSRLNRPVLVAGARDLSSLEIPLVKGRVLFVQPQLQGQQWAEVDLRWRADAAGWYSPELARKFAERWQALQSRRAAGVDETERRQIEASERDLVDYAPTRVEAKSIFGYRLIDMTTAWYKKNALSADMAKVKSF